MTVEVRGFQLITVGTVTTVWAVVEQDGAGLDLGDLASVPTVTITRGDGTEIVSDQQATVNAGRLSYELTPANTDTLDELAVDWTFELVAGTPVTFRTRAEIVGAQLFTIGEARKHDKKQADSAPMERIEAMRAQITDDFAAIAGVQFIPRARRIVLDGSGAADLWLPDLRPQSVNGVEVRQSDGSWEAWATSDVEALEVEQHGQVFSPVGQVFPRGRRNIRLSYVHGYAVPPAEVRNAALTLLTYEINPSNLSERALSFSDDTGTFRLAAPGERGRSYGLPYVDAVLARYSEHVPRIA